MSQTHAVHSQAAGIARNRQRARTASGRRNPASKSGPDDPHDQSTLDLNPEICQVDRMAVRRAVQDAMAARQKAIASQRRAADEFAESLALAHATYLDFRSLANVLFRERRDRAALGLFNRPPTDARAFVKAARLAYREALQEPRITKLTLYGCDAGLVEAALDGLAAVLAARQQLLSALSHTTEAMVMFANARRVA